jgi:hypothetical protein
MNRQVQKLVRLRAGFVIAAIVLPLALFALFERQARRLDALALKGELVEAYVTGISRDKGTTFYAYRVNGTEYTWNVAHREAPFSVGAAFPVSYLPDDPSFSRPVTDQSLLAKGATDSRSSSWKVVIGLGLTLLTFAGLVHSELRSVRSGARSEQLDPRDFKRRLSFVPLLLLPGFVLVTHFHLKTSIERQESILPVLIALVLCVAIVGSVLVFLGREGPSKVRERSARLFRWTAPVGLGIAVLKLLALLFRK